MRVMTLIVHHDVRDLRTKPMNRLAPNAGTGWCSSADGDGGFAGFCGFHLVGDAHRLFDEGFHDGGLGDGFDDLALDEDLALSVAGGNAEVGFPGLAGAVDDA